MKRGMKVDTCEGLLLLHIKMAADLAPPSTACTTRVTGLECNKKRKRMGVAHLQGSTRSPANQTRNRHAQAEEQQGKHRYPERA